VTVSEAISIIGTSRHVAEREARCMEAAGDEQDPHADPPAGAEHRRVGLPGRRRGHMVTVSRLVLTSSVATTGVIIATYRPAGAKRTRPQRY